MEKLNNCVSQDQNDRVAYKFDNSCTVGKTALEKSKVQFFLLQAFRHKINFCNNQNSKSMFFWSQRYILMDIFGIAWPLCNNQLFVARFGNYHHIRITYGDNNTGQVIMSNWCQGRFFYIIQWFFAWYKRVKL